MSRYSASSKRRNFIISLLLPDGTLHKTIGRFELAERERRGEFQSVRTDHKGNIIARLKEQAEPLRSIHEASKSSITHIEMLANIGINGRPNSTIACSHIRRRMAQAKIAAFAPEKRASKPIDVQEGVHSKGLISSITAA